MNGFVHHVSRPKAKLLPSRQNVFLLKGKLRPSENQNRKGTHQRESCLPKEYQRLQISKRHQFVVVLEGPEKTSNDLSLPKKKKHLNDVDQDAPEKRNKDPRRKPQKNEVRAGPPKQKEKKEEDRAGRESQRLSRRRRKRAKNRQTLQSANEEDLPRTRQRRTKQRLVPRRAPERAGKEDGLPRTNNLKNLQRRRQLSFALPTDASCHRQRSGKARSLRIRSRLQRRKSLLWKRNKLHWRLPLQW